jgi:hypothetical protein
MGTAADALGDVPREGAANPVWGVAWAMVPAWLAVGLAAVPAILLEASPGRARAAALAWHLLQCIAAGFVTATVVALWQRRGPRAPVFAALALTVLATLLAFAALRPDLEVAASKLPIAEEVAEVLLTLAGAASVPLCWLAARLVRRLRVGRVLCAVAAAGLLTVQQLVLPNDYLGVHLFVVWAASVWACFAVAPLALPWSRRTQIAAQAVLCVLAAVALGAHPANSSSIVLLRTGSALAPFLMRLHAMLPRTAGASERSGWLADRSQRPPVAPSTPSLAPERPIVVLLTVDALRADVFADPARAKQLPSFARLRREGVDFPEMRSTSPGTNASISSLFTSKFFSQLYWSMKPGSIMKRQCPHLDDSLRFPAVLGSRGIPTVNVFTMRGFDEEFGLARGFSEEIRVGEGRKNASADEMATRAVARIREAGDGPLFLWMHFADAHAPYDLGGKKGSQFERYVREVALVDAALGKMRQATEEMGVAARTVWMISADHGEAFGEHGQRHHATTVYDELLRVPLVIAVPGVRPRVVKERVSLLDIGPTVLDLLGFETPGAMMGETLVPWLRGETPALDRPIVAESSRGLQSLTFPDGLKVILDRYQGTVEVYDLGRDPKELDNLADEGGPMVDQNVELTRAFFRAHEHRRPGYRTPSIR